MTAGMVGRDDGLVGWWGAELFVSGMVGICGWMDGICAVSLKASCVLHLLAFQKYPLR